MIFISDPSDSSSSCEDEKTRGKLSNCGQGKDTFDSIPSAPRDFSVQGKYVFRSISNIYQGVDTFSIFIHYLKKKGILFKRVQNVIVSLREKI